MGMHGKDQVLWIHETALTAAQVVNVAVGMENSGSSVANCKDCQFMTWGFVSELQVDVEIQGSNDAAFAVFDVLSIQTPAGNTYTTPYQLGGNQGLNGFFVLTRPFIRIVLTEQETAIHAFTRLFARAWGG